MIICFWYLFIGMQTQGDNIWGCNQWVGECWRGQPEAFHALHHQERRVFESYHDIHQECVLRFGPTQKPRWEEEKGTVLSNIIHCWWWLTFSFQGFKWETIHSLFLAHVRQTVLHLPLGQSYLWRSCAPLRTSSCAGGWGPKIQKWCCG